MTAYAIMLEARAGALPEPEDWRLRPDGFAILGLAFPTIWCLFHRLWLVAIAAFAIPLLAATLPGDPGSKALAATLASFAVGLFVGLEGRALAIARAERRGARTLGVIEANGIAEAEDKLAVLATMEAARSAEASAVRTPPAVPGVGGVRARAAARTPPPLPEAVPAGSMPRPGVAPRWSASRRRSAMLPLRGKA